MNLRMSCVLRLGLALLLSHLGLSVSAALEPLPPIPLNPLPISKSIDEPSCDQLVERLESIRKMMTEHHESVGTFIDEVSARIDRWYRDLAPLETSKAIIPLGHFAPLKAGAEEITEVLNLVYDNADYLDRHLESVQNGLAKCLSAPKPKLTTR